MSSHLLPKPSLVRQALQKLSSSKSELDLSREPSTKQPQYPSDPSKYELLEDCGRGVSATVHRAIYKETGEVMAVKKMNLERVSMSLNDIIHEAQTMKSYHHPNVLPLYTSFVHGQDLWMVTPFMSGGSVLHIMKYKFPEGLDEVVIATIMKFVLQGLEYVHKNNGIHRDVKAGNILMDKDGTVRIGDFGVAATPKGAERDGDWTAESCNRTTFVGTPCWMAPEVMEQSEYNQKADIWSFGITLLELANGHAPFAKMPPMKVLLLTIQNPPPQLDDQAGRRHFSKHLHNVITRCLKKDAKERPTATELLNDKFFKQAKDEEFLVRTLLYDMPALGERVQLIRDGKAATNAADNDKQLERSQEEYVKGVSAWNFDVAKIKAEAALLGDDHLGAPHIGSGGSATSGPPMPSIAEAPETVELEGSGSSSRRSTDDAAATTAAPAAAPSSSAAAATGVQQPFQQQPQQQSVQPLQPGLLQQSFAAAAGAMPAGAAAAQPPQQLQADAAAKAAATQQQQQQSNMRRATSAFAGSQALAAAAAAAAGSTAAVGAGGTLQGHFSEPVGQQASSGQQHSGSGMPPQPPSLAGAGASSGGSSYCMSPLTSSPPMSRESSSQGPLSALATPDGIPLKGKSKGRFQIYEAGEQPPPMSPPASRGALNEGLSGSFTKVSVAAAATAATAATAVHDSSGSIAGGTTASAAMPRISDSTGGNTETPRATRQVLGAAEAAELKAAAAAATAAAGTTGPVGDATAPAGVPGIASGGTATPPLRIVTGVAAAGVGAAAGAAVSSASGGLSVAGMTTGGTASEGAEAAAANETKRGRFKIIKEDAPSRGSFSKTPSSADLSGAGRGAGQGAAGSVGRGMGVSPAAVLPELLRLHEQALLHSNALARLIDGMRASASGSNLASVEDVSLAAAVSAATAAAPSSASGAAAMPPVPRKHSAPAGGAGAVVGVAAAGAGVGVGSGLIRGNSSRALAGGQELRTASLHVLLQEVNGDAMELADRLLERAQELECQVGALELELARFRPSRAILDGSFTAGASAVESADNSRVASRRTSTANLVIPAFAPPAAAAGAAVGGVVASGDGGVPVVERCSSSGASGGDSGGGAPPALQQ